MGAPLPIPTFAEILPTIDAIRADSPAGQAGIQVGDRVTKIDEQDITTKNEVYAAVAESGGRSLTVEVRRGDTLKTFLVTPELYDPENVEHPLYVIGIEEAAPIVTAVMPDMPAAEAGLKENDRILEIQGETIQTWSQMTRIVKAHPNVPLTMKVDREGAILTLTIVPQPHEVTDNGTSTTVGKIGIMGSGRSVIRASSPLMAVVQGVKATWGWSELTVVGIYKMLTGEISSKNIGGPIMIASASGTAAERGLP